MTWSRVGCGGISVIPAFWRLWQKTLKFEASLGYRVRLYLYLIKKRKMHFFYIYCVTKLFHCCFYNRNIKKDCDKSTPVIPALRRQRQESSEYKDALSFSHRLKKKKYDSFVHLKKRHESLLTVKLCKQYFNSTNKHRIFFVMMECPEIR
jgi:hypothetical protein